MNDDEFAKGFLAFAKTKTGDYYASRADHCALAQYVLSMDASFEPQYSGWGQGGAFYPYPDNCYDAAVRADSNSVMGKYGLSADNDYTWEGLTKRLSHMLGA